MSDHDFLREQMREELSPTGIATKVNENIAYILNSKGAVYGKSDSRHTDPDNFWSVNCQLKEESLIVEAYATGLELDSLTAALGSNLNQSGQYIYRGQTYPLKLIVGNQKPVKD